MLFEAQRYKERWRLSRGKDGEGERREAEGDLKGIIPIFVSIFLCIFLIWVYLLEMGMLGFIRTLIQVIRLGM